MIWISDSEAQSAAEGWGSQFQALAQFHQSSQAFFFGNEVQSEDAGGLHQRALAARYQYSPHEMSPSATAWRSEKLFMGWCIIGAVAFCQLSRGWAHKLRIGK